MVFFTSRYNPKFFHASAWVCRGLDHGRALAKCTWTLDSTTKSLQSPVGVPRAVSCCGVWSEMPAQRLLYFRLRKRRMMYGNYCEEIKSLCLSLRTVLIFASGFASGSNRPSFFCHVVYEYHVPSNFEKPHETSPRYEWRVKGCCKISTLSFLRQLS